MTLDTTQSSLSAPLMTPNLLPDIQGQHSFVQTAYNLPFHCTTFSTSSTSSSTVSTYSPRGTKLWKTPSFPTTILPSPEPNFRIQFQTASSTSTSPHGPTGAEVAETELAERQAIQERNDIADSHTQDVIVTVLHSCRKVDEALELAEEIPEYDDVDNYTQDEALELAEEIPEYDDADVIVLHSCRTLE
ncbi:hypothetical protein BDZ91DRAFT_800367 [Kalaharituber pfeilii]|nr:hypothetical protein BDZ91DRAFT_800367 [Kalaharituber pfeilii]